MDTPKTILEAEAAGWSWLECSCEPCRQNVHFPFRMLKQRTTHQSLERVMRQMRCQRCRAPATKFALVRQVYTGGGQPDFERVALAFHAPITPSP